MVSGIWGRRPSESMRGGRQGPEELAIAAAALFFPGLEARGADDGDVGQPVQQLHVLGAADPESYGQRQRRRRAAALQVLLQRGIEGGLAARDALAGDAVDEAAGAFPDLREALR